MRNETSLSGDVTQGYPSYSRERSLPSFLTLETLTSPSRLESTSPGKWVCRVRIQNSKRSKRVGSVGGIVLGTELTRAFVETSRR